LEEVDMADFSPVYLTAEGHRALKAELDELIKVRRPEMAQRLHVAIKQGDLSENADYIAAKEAQGFLEGRILELQQKLRDAVIIEESPSSDGIVVLGSHVTVVEDGFDDNEVYHIVGVTEADPTKGRISHVSPLGKALLGHKINDIVAIHAPAGEILFKILDVA
jgi:transcription elongation factor GreA